MKRLTFITILTASLLMLSCSKDVNVDVLLDGGIEYSFNAKVAQSDINSTISNAGVFTNRNSNVQFISQDEVNFKGTLSNESSDEFVYATSPYQAGKRVEANGEYIFSIPTEQVQQSYKSDVTPYAYMVGCSKNRLTATKGANRDFSSTIEFEHLMSQMDFIVANNTGSKIIVKRVIMTAPQNSFATSASIKMSNEAIDMNSYEVSTPNCSSLSVRVANPAEIANDRCEVISMMFFPIEMEGATELEFTIETDKGNFKVVKTIGGLGKVNFERGIGYKTPLSLR